MQLNFARSIDPIVQQEITTTSRGDRRADAERKDRGWAKHIMLRSIVQKAMYLPC